METLPGRPTKLTPAVQERLIQALAIGNHRKVAADYAGVDEKTVRRWMARGIEEPNGPCGALRDAVRQAESKAQIMAQGCITQAARNGDWRAAAWFLERRVPERFSPNSRLFDPVRVLDILEEAGVEFDRKDAVRALAGSDAPFLRRDTTAMAPLTSEAKREAVDLLRRLRGERVQGNGA